MADLNKQKIQIISLLNTLAPAFDAISVVGAVSKFDSWEKASEGERQTMYNEISHLFDIKEDEWQLFWKVVEGTTNAIEVAQPTGKAVIQDAEPPATPASVVCSLMESYGSKNIREFGGNFGEIAKTFGQVFKTLVPEVEFATNSENLAAMKKLSKRIGTDNAERFLYAASRFDMALKEAILFGTGYSVEARDGSTAFECYNKGGL